MTDTYPMLIPIIHVWAADAAAHPAEFEQMQKLIELDGSAGALETLLQQHGIDEADIMPAQTPNAAYEIYAYAELFGGMTVTDSIARITGFTGVLLAPFESEYQFDQHLRKRGLTLIYSNPAPLQDVL